MLFFALLLFCPLFSLAAGITGTHNLGCVLSDGIDGEGGRRSAIPWRVAAGGCGGGAPVVLVVEYDGDVEQILVESAEESWDEVDTEVHTVSLYRLRVHSHVKVDNSCPSPFSPHAPPAATVTEIVVIRHEDERDFVPLWNWLANLLDQPFVGVFREAPLSDVEEVRARATSAGWSVPDHHFYRASACHESPLVTGVWSVDKPLAALLKQQYDYGLQLARAELIRENGGQAPSPQDEDTVSDRAAALTGITSQIAWATVCPSSRESDAFPRLVKDYEEFGIPVPEDPLCEVAREAFEASTFADDPLAIPEQCIPGFDGFPAACACPFWAPVRHVPTGSCLPEQRALVPLMEVDVESGAVSSPRWLIGTEQPVVYETMDRREDLPDSFFTIAVLPAVDYAAASQLDRIPVLWSQSFVRPDVISGYALDEQVPESQSGPFLVSWVIPTGELRVGDPEEMARRAAVQQATYSGDDGPTEADIDAAFNAVVDAVSLAPIHAGHIQVVLFRQERFDEIDSAVQIDEATGKSTGGYIHVHQVAHTAESHTVSISLSARSCAASDPALVGRTGVCVSRDVCFSHAYGRAMQSSHCDGAGSLTCCHIDALSGMESFYPAPLPVADVCQTPFPTAPLLPYWSLIEPVAELVNQGCRVSSVSEQLEDASDLRVSSVDAELAAWTGSGIAFAHPSWRDPSSVIERSAIHVDLPLTTPASMSARVDAPSDMADALADNPVVDPLLERKLVVARAGAMQALADIAWLEEALDAAEIELSDGEESDPIDARKRCRERHIRFKPGDYWGNTGTMSPSSVGVYEERQRAAALNMAAHRKLAAESAALEEALDKKLRTSVNQRNAAATQRVVRSMAKPQLMYNRRYALALLARLKEIDSIMVSRYNIGGELRGYLAQLDVCISTGSAHWSVSTMGRSARRLRMSPENRARRACQSRLAALIRQSQKYSWGQAALRDADEYARRVARIATPKCGPTKRASGSLCTVLSRITTSQRVMVSNAAESQRLISSVRSTVGKVGKYGVSRIGAALSVPVVGWLIGILDIAYLAYSAVIDWPYMACDLNSAWDCSPVFTVGNSMTVVWDELHNSIVLANEPGLLTTVAGEQASVWLCPEVVDKDASVDILTGRCINTGFDSTVLEASPLAAGLSLAERRLRGRNTHEIALLGSPTVPLVPTLSYRLVLRAGEETGVSMPFVIGTVGCSVDAAGTEGGVCASQAACQDVMKGTWNAVSAISCHSAPVQDGRNAMGCCVGALDQYTSTIARVGGDEGTSASPAVIAIAVTASLCCIIATCGLVVCAMVMIHRRRGARGGKAGFQLGTHSTRRRQADQGASHSARHGHSRRAISRSASGNLM